MNAFSPQAYTVNLSKEYSVDIFHIFLALEAKL
jgi:hypothetical protein